MKIDEFVNLIRNPLGWKIERLNNKPSDEVIARRTTFSVAKI